jgi:hypothetical protein
MEVLYFDYYLNHNGKPFPKVALEKADDPLLARFSVTAPHPLAKVEVYWAKADPDVKARVWTPIPATLNGKVYEAKLPPETADWFALVSDDRPVTVSSDMIHVP